MYIRILSIGNKMPSWVNEGYREYAKRFPISCKLELFEISLDKNPKREEEKMIAAIKPGHRIIALDVQGVSWSTEELAKHLNQWQQEGKNIDLLVGGPNGLPSQCLNKAEMKWSLSALTLPHLMVRIILAEQLYRALTILQGHPYHRA